MFNVFKTVYQSFVEGYNEAKYAVNVDKAMAVFTYVVRESGKDVNVVLVEGHDVPEGVMAFVNADQQDTIHVFKENLNSVHFINLCKRSKLPTYELLGCIAAHELGHTQDVHMNSLVQSRLSTIRTIQRAGMRNITVDMVDAYHKDTIQLEANAYHMGMDYAPNKKAYIRFNEDNLAMYQAKYLEEMALYKGGQ